MTSTNLYLLKIRPHSAPRERYVTSPSLKRGSSPSPTRLSNHSLGAEVGRRTQPATSARQSIGITPDQGGHVWNPAAKCLLESSHGNENRNAGICGTRNREQSKLQPQQEGEGGEKGGGGGGGKRERNRRQFRQLLESTRRWSTGATESTKTRQAVENTDKKPTTVKETTNNGNIRNERRGDAKGKAQVSLESARVRNGSGPFQNENCTTENPLRERRTALGMPQGHRVGATEMEEARKRRAAMRKGASFPLSRGVDTLDVTPCPNSPEFRPRPTRPKSAEFFRDVHDLPCFTKTHSKSPSEGDRDIVQMIRSQLDHEKVKKPESPTPTTPSGSSILQKLFNFRKSPSRDKSPSKTVKSELHFVPIKNENNTDQTLSPTSMLNVSDLEQEIRVRRYHSLPRRSIEDIRSPTPPIAIFSSDEDISSVPSTPKRTRSGRTSLSESGASKKSPSSSRPRTPELDCSKDPIETVLLSPPKYKTCCVVDLEKQSLCSGEGLPGSLSDCDPARLAATDVNKGETEAVTNNKTTSAKAKPRQRKYAAGPRHHSDIVAYLPPPSPRTHPRVQQGYAKTRHKPDSKPTQLTYTKQRHHTIDLACIVITPPDSSETTNPTFPSGTPPPEVTTPRPLLPSSYMQSSPRTKGPPSSSSGLAISRSSPQRRLLHSLSQDSGSGTLQKGAMNPKPPYNFGRQASISEEELQRGSRISDAQNKTSLPSAAMTLKTPTAECAPSSSSPSQSRAAVTLRRQRPVSTLSPDRQFLRERPKSDCLTVRWADSLRNGAEDDGDVSDGAVSDSGMSRRGRKSLKERPKSDLGELCLVHENHLEMR